MKLTTLVFIGSACLLPLTATIGFAQQIRFDTVCPNWPSFPQDTQVTDMDPLREFIDPLSGFAGSYTTGQDSLSLGVSYFAPSIRGHEILGSLIPYEEIWLAHSRATLFTTDTDIEIGGFAVPKGAYTLYFFPSRNGWKLIVSKQTCQRGIDYDERQVLGRVAMKSATPPSSPVETLSIHFERPQGVTCSVRCDPKNGPYLSREDFRTIQLHLLWENTNVYVPISANERSRAEAAMTSP